MKKLSLGFNGNLFIEEKFKNETNLEKMFLENFGNVGI
ncbi:hypothetical protein FLAN108750_03110 [Flavobacterium antarcticum]